MISIMIDQVTDAVGRGTEQFVMTLTHSGPDIRDVKLESGIRTRDEVYDEVVAALYPAGRP